jgi:ABC-type branched-subunit amino acid transport system substrate-binding protein
LADSAYARGLPAALDGRVLITSPALGASAYPPAGRAFLEAYVRRYGAPQPDAILGYEAMRLLLSAIARATDHGHAPAERSKVVKALFATHRRRSVLGTYGIESDGDTSTTRYGVWTVVGRRMRFFEALGG